MAYFMAKIEILGGGGRPKCILVSSHAYVIVQTVLMSAFICDSVEGAL